MTEECGFWQQRRLTRRRALQGIAIGGAGVATLSLLACTSGSPGAPSTGRSSIGNEPKRGGTLTHQNGYETLGQPFDSHVGPPVATNGFRLFYQGLLGYNLRTFVAEAELAQKWEQPSQNEYIFTLQPNVKWQNKPPANGRPLTVEDVVFSLERVRTNDPRFISRSLLNSVDKIEAVDSSRVRITTRSPDATTLDKLAADATIVMNPEVVERAGKFSTAESAVGTGAFLLQTVEEGVGATYSPNPDYWKPGRPYLAGFRTRHFVDDQAAYAAFLAGQVDIARIPGVEVKAYIARQGSGYQPDWFKDNTFIMGVPNTKAKPVDDPRVRRALRLLQDYDEWRTAWAEVWFGQGRHGSILPTNLESWDLSEDEYGKLIFWKQPKDDAVKEALSLLSAAGYSRENPLKFELAVQGPTPFVVAAAQLMQAQWRRLGQGVVDASPLKEHTTVQADTVSANRQFTYFVRGLAGQAPEPDAYLSQLYRTGGSRNYGDFSDAKADELIDRQRTVFDLQQRKAVIRELVLYMIDNGPNILGSNRYFLNSVNPKVRDFAPEFYMNGRQYEWVWLDA
jgi:peptide/nickel transport system substrate-binding protein